MNKTDLINYRKLVLEVEHLRITLASFEASMDSPTGSKFSDMPRAASHQSSALENAILKHFELRDKYFEKIAEKEAMLDAIEDALETLDDPGERLVMRYRYIDGWRWQRICMRLQTLGYSDRQVYRLHAAALLKLEEIKT